MYTVDMHQCIETRVFRARAALISEISGPSTNRVGNQGFGVLPIFVIRHIRFTPIGRKHPLLHEGQPGQPHL